MVYFCKYSSNTSRRNVTMNDKKGDNKRVFKNFQNFGTFNNKKPRNWGRHDDKGAFVGCKPYSPLYSPRQREGIGTTNDTYNYGIPGSLVA